MTEMTQIIAEAEGIRTPSRKRTKAELKEIHTNYVAKKAKKKPHPVLLSKSTQSLRDRKRAESAKAVVVKQRTPPTFIEPIEMNFISATGYGREAAYDPATKMFHIAFAKSTWAMPSTVDAWNTFEKAVADPVTDIDAFYRKAYRGRTTDMLPVRSTAKAQRVAA